MTDQNGSGDSGSGIGVSGSCTGSGWGSGAGNDSRMVTMVGCIRAHRVSAVVASPRVTTASAAGISVSATKSSKVAMARIRAPYAGVFDVPVSEVSCLKVKVSAMNLFPLGKSLHCAKTLSHFQA